VGNCGSTLLAATRSAIRGIDAYFGPLETLCNETDGDENLRELTLESLQRTINQFKEEIARYEAHHAVR
jgi:hypothetical protein